MEATRMVLIGAELYMVLCISIVSIRELAKEISNFSVEVEYKFNI